MGKIRVSHFITKNIQVTTCNSTTVPNQKSNEIKPYNIQIKKEPLKSSLKGITKLTQAYRKEAVYAIKPIYKRSIKILEAIEKAAKEFKEVGKVRKKKKIRITSVTKVVSKYVSINVATNLD